MVMASKTHNMLKVTKMEKTERHYCGGFWPESFFYWTGQDPHTGLLLMRVESHS